jgi:hypothetical protein
VAPRPPAGQRLAQALEPALGLGPVLAQPPWVPVLALPPPPWV